MFFTAKVTAFRQISEIDKPEESLLKVIILFYYGRVYVLNMRI